MQNKPSEMANNLSKLNPALQQLPLLGFDNTSEWPAWINHFDYYRFATALNERSGEAQVRTLLYTMGRHAREVFSTFGLTEAEEEIMMPSKRSLKVILSKSRTSFMKVPAFTDASNNRTNRWTSSRLHFTFWRTVSISEI